jgi:malate dehydrogenase (oxaloacetate-decarboxylating)
MSAINEGMSRPCAFSTYQHEFKKDRLRRLIDQMRWQPKYLPLHPM